MAPRTKAATDAAVPAEDVSMMDAPTANLSGDDFLAFDKQTIRVLPGSSETAASFEFTGEDHTLGNALRWMIMKNPDVEFCGYSIPHPSEPKMSVRIQTYGDVTAFSVLEKGLDDLMDLCDVVSDKFVQASTEFTENS